MKPDHQVSIRFEAGKRIIIREYHDGRRTVYEAPHSTTGGAMAMPGT